MMTEGPTRTIKSHKPVATTDMAMLDANDMLTLHNTKK